MSCFTRSTCCLLCIRRCTSVEIFSAVQAYAVLAAEPHPGDVKRFSWVLLQTSPHTFHLWPELNDTLRQETVRGVHEVRLLALPCLPACLLNAIDVSWCLNVYLIPKQCVPGAGPHKRRGPGGQPAAAELCQSGNKEITRLNVALCHFDAMLPPQQ